MLLISFLWVLILFVDLVKTIGTSLLVLAVCSFLEFYLSKDLALLESAFEVRILSRFLSLPICSSDLWDMSDTM